MGTFTYMKSSQLTWTVKHEFFTDRIPLLSIRSIRTDRHMAYTDSYGAGVLHNPRHLSNLNKENTLDNFYYELKCMKCIRVCSRSSLNFFLVFFNPFDRLLILLWRSCSLSYLYWHFKISYFNSYDFHHRVYYELTMACSPVGLISSMDGALRPAAITRVRVWFPIKPKFFQVLFQPLWLLFLL